MDSMPSWSWAKLDATRVGMHRLDDDRVDAVVLHAETSPAGQDEFGDVVVGKIVLLGRIRSFTGKVETDHGYDERK
jgi:hypothetical protein